MNLLENLKKAYDMNAMAPITPTNGRDKPTDIGMTKNENGFLAPLFSHTKEILPIDKRYLQTVKMAFKKTYIHLLIQSINKPGLTTAEEIMTDFFSSIFIDPVGTRAATGAIYGTLLQTLSTRPTDRVHNIIADTLLDITKGEEEKVNIVYNALERDDAHILSQQFYIPYVTLCYNYLRFLEGNRCQYACYPMANSFSADRGNQTRLTVDAFGLFVEKFNAVLTDGYYAHTYYYLLRLFIRNGIGLMNKQYNPGRQWFVPMDLVLFRTQNSVGFHHDSTASSLVKHAYTHKQTDFINVYVTLQYLENARQSAQFTLELHNPNWITGYHGSQSHPLLYGLQQRITQCYTSINTEFERVKMYLFLMLVLLQRFIPGNILNDVVSRIDSQTVELALPSFISEFLCDEHEINEASNQLSTIIHNIQNPHLRVTDASHPSFTDLYKHESSQNRHPVPRTLDALQHHNVGIRLDQRVSPLMENILQSQNPRPQHICGLSNCARQQPARCGYTTDIFKFFLTCDRTEHYRAKQHLYTLLTSTDICSTRYSQPFEEDMANDFICLQYLSCVHIDGLEAAINTIPTTFPAIIQDSLSKVINDIKDLFETDPRKQGADVAKNNAVISKCRDDVALAITSVSRMAQVLHCAARDCTLSDYDTITFMDTIFKHTSPIHTEIVGASEIGLNLRRPPPLEVETRSRSFLRMYWQLHVDPRADTARALYNNTYTNPGLESFEFTYNFLINNDIYDVLDYSRANQFRVTEPVWNSTILADGQQAGIPKSTINQMCCATQKCPS